MSSLRAGRYECHRGTGVLVRRSIASLESIRTSTREVVSPITSPLVISPKEALVEATDDVRINGSSMCVSKNSQHVDRQERWQNLHTQWEIRDPSCDLRSIRQRSSVLVRRAVGIPRVGYMVDGRLVI